MKLRPYPTLEFYVDPAIATGMRWWRRWTGTRCAAAQIPGAVHLRPYGLVGLSDAWTAWSWSRWWSRQESRPSDIVVLHADDHRDLAPARLAFRYGGLVDVITNDQVDLAVPESIRAAIESSAIGMGSFFMPILHAGTRVHVRHLQPPGPRRLRPGSYCLSVELEEDPLFGGASRLVPNLGDIPSDNSVTSTYQVGDNVRRWVASIPSGAPVLVHIDMDYFNDRYDGDSDWRENSRHHSPEEPGIRRRLDDVLEALNRLGDSISDVAIGISPGFFPAELWPGCIEHIDNYLLAHRQFAGDSASAGINSRLGRVELRPGHIRSASRHEQFWHVYAGGSRAGRVAIRDAHDPTLGAHQSIDVHINAAARGQGVGTVVFRLAADLSGADRVYVHARRSNVASRKAASRAGYWDITGSESAQSIMVWKRTAVTN